MKLIRELPPRYRMVFNLYVFESMTHREIAAELQISEGTSKSNLARARMILKNRIRKELVDAEKNFTA
jgi:RNA polymerase sigma-70 factor (ECF subfamily)